MIKDDVIRYSVRYKVVGASGILVLPMWIPSECNPMDYARKILSDAYSSGCEIVNLQLVGDKIL